jgi:hypothetical protein
MLLCVVWWRYVLRDPIVPCSDGVMRPREQRRRASSIAYLMDRGSLLGARIGVRLRHGYEALRMAFVQMNGVYVMDKSALQCALYLS